MTRWINQFSWRRWIHHNDPRVHDDEHKTSVVITSILYGSIEYGESARTIPRNLFQVRINPKNKFLLLFVDMVRCKTISKRFIQFYSIYCLDTRDTPHLIHTTNRHQPLKSPQTSFWHSIAMLTYLWS